MSDKRSSCFSWLCKAVVCGLLVPFMWFCAFTVWSAHYDTKNETLRRVDCSNNLRDIWCALDDYRYDHGQFPPAFSTDENGARLLSWRVLILPYFSGEEKGQLYDSFALDEPWDSATNWALRAKMPSVYRCPSAIASIIAPSLSSYAAVVERNVTSDESVPLLGAQATDTPEDTLMVVEISRSDICWTEPHDVYLDAPTDWFSNTACPRVGGNHTFRNPIYVNVLFCNGSVRSSLSESRVSQLLRRMRDVVEGDEKEKVIAPRSLAEGDD